MAAWFNLSAAVTGRIKKNILWALKGEPNCGWPNSRADYRVCGDILLPAHYPLPTICHLMPCQMSIALRAKTVRDLCAKDEPCGGLNPKVAKSAKCGANGEDRWKKMWILVAQVPRCCPTLVAHCSLAMQYLSQKGGKKIIKAKDSDRGLCTFHVVWVVCVAG